MEQVGDCESTWKMVHHLFDNCRELDQTWAYRWQTKLTDHQSCRNSVHCRAQFLLQPESHAVHLNFGSILPPPHFLQSPPRYPKRSRGMN